MPNRLANETSPYLLQHANNPVDWYPWGPEALERARAEDKPILLSVGYSACHWCHVMERESFEDTNVAAIMNRCFVNIKVDREERPDLDSIYMQAVQALTGQGGWPMTVFLTPLGEPFYGGTYFPPQDRGPMPGFPRLLHAMDQVYRTRRGDITAAASELVGRLKQQNNMRSQTDLLTRDLLKEAYLHVSSGYDGQNGGFGGAPKFPQPMVLDFLLRYHHATGDADAANMTLETLRKMAMGGIFDQLGGGFHRYSTDAFWLVPHFEKMLCDNALLSRLYLHAFQVTGDGFYSRVTEKILDYVLEEMTGPEGGFYSSQDADSEGEEGKFFLWTHDEVQQALGEKDAEILCAYLDITPGGNFEGKNIPNVPRFGDSLADDLDITFDQLNEVLDRGVPTLLAIRNNRVRPDRDDKVITAWNGLMLRSFAEAAATLGYEEYGEAAAKNAQFLLDNLLDENKRVLRTYKSGRARFKGYLEDYSFLADGLLAVNDNVLSGTYWLEQSVTVADLMLDLFWDEENGIFYDTGKDHEALLLRPRDFFDNATPCGASVAVDVLLRLAVLTGRERYREVAGRALRSMGPMLSQYALGMGRWLSALDFYLSQPKEIVFMGSDDTAKAWDLRGVVHDNYIPNRALMGDSQSDPKGESPWPLLRGRPATHGRPTVYVCENYVCKLPVTEVKDLKKLLGV